MVIAVLCLIHSHTLSYSLIPSHVLLAKLPICYLLTHNVSLMLTTPTHTFSPLLHQLPGTLNEESRRTNRQFPVASDLYASLFLHGVESIALRRQQWDTHAHWRDFCHKKCILVEQR